jgi:hypothetical protein
MALSSRGPDGQFLNRDKVASRAGWPASNDENAEVRLSSTARLEAASQVIAARLTV